MTDPDTIAADYTLRPSELAETLALLVEARQTTMVWGPPGSAKSQIAQQVAADTGRQYIDVRALLLDPVDLRGIPWRDGTDRTRWAPPAFLPPTDDPGRWLINLEELPSAVPMVQASLYQARPRPQGGRVRAARGCCSACNFDPQYQATSIAYRADRRATHAPNNRPVARHRAKHNRQRARRVPIVTLKLPAHFITVTAANENEKHS